MTFQYAERDAIRRTTEAEQTRHVETSFAQEYSSLLSSDFGIKTADPKKAYDSVPGMFKTPQMVQVLNNYPEVRTLLAQAIAYQELKGRTKAPRQAPRSEQQQPNQPAQRQQAPTTPSAVTIEMLMGKGRK